jgi:hypothetical protein
VEGFLRRHELGIINHVDGSIDAQAMWHDIDWLQVD